MKEATLRYIYILLLAALTFCSASMGAAGMRAAEAAEGVVTGSVVNVRSGAGTQYAVAGSLYQDTKVEIISHNGEWYNIRCGQASGWLHESLLQVEESAPELTVSRDQVNLRSGPGTNFSIIGQARQGDSLTLIDAVGEWYKAKTDAGQVVYLRADMTGTVDSLSNDADNPTIDNPPPAATTAAVSVPSRAAAVKIPSIILDGQPMHFEVAPVLEDNRVLVPLRAIFEAMGAEVDWDQARQTATATRGNTVVVLPLNSTAPTVNGSVWHLDVPAKAVQQRILAPLRFVGEALGGSATWDSNNYKVVLVSPEDDGAAVVAVTISSEQVNLRSGPSTSFALLASAKFGERLAVLDESNGWYKVSRGGQQAWVAGWLVDVVREGDPSAAPVASPIQTPEPEPEPVVTLAGVSISSERSADGLKIIMDSGQKLSAEIDETSGQVRYEFANRQMEGTTTLEKYLFSSKLTVVGRNSGSSALVTIDFPAGVKYATSTENNGKRQVFTVPNYIDSVNRSTFGSSGENITINSIAPIKYTSTPETKQLELVLEDTQIGKAQSAYKYSSPLISSMTFKTQTVSGKTNTTLTITASKAVKFSVGTSNDDSTLNILFVDQSVIQSRTPLVVLDAGHGGRDPGASGNVLAEKEVNLDLVLKAGKLLTAQGIKVVYTRQDDTYVGLEERPTMANMYNAAVFVSVHNNANVSSTPSGTETYCYYPLSDPNLYMQKEERYNLALRLQEALADKLGRNDRGVKQANLAVLRETDMPSALIEMMFISNPTEEALLQQDKILDLGAQAIADGIADFMKAYLNTR